MPRSKRLALCELDLVRLALVKKNAGQFNSNNNASEFAIEEVASVLANISLSQRDMQAIAMQLQVESVALQTSGPFSHIAPEQHASSHSDPLALHHAARRGDMVAAKHLIRAGANVNQKDIFGSTPLHMAAMYGHKSMAEYLLASGAQINAKTYQLNELAYTPLDLAADYAENDEIFRFLLQKGAQPGHWDNLVSTLVWQTLESYENLDFQAFDLSLRKIEMAGKQTSSALWVYTETEVKPVYILYKSIATSLESQAYYQRLMQTVDYLWKIDKTHLAEHYITAKNLLHAFPSDNDYMYQIGPNNVKINASGYFAFLTVELAFETLSAYRQSLVELDVNGFAAVTRQYTTIEAAFLQSAATFTQEKQAVFQRVEHIFKQGAIAAEQAACYEVSVDIFEQYEQGKTILLPCGWEGHAIDIIINKDLNLFMVANAGDRFPALHSGLNAYHMGFPLLVNDVYEILNNQEQINLEFKKFYDMGLVEDRNYSFEMPSQRYGNCAWYSQEIAQKALLFVEILKDTDNLGLALKLADNWYHEYLDFHQMAVLTAYLDDPYLEMTALGDILLEYHSTLQTRAEQERATLILDVLKNPKNVNEFEKYYEANADDMSHELKNFISNHSSVLSGFVLSEQDIIEWNSPVQEVLFDMPTLAPPPFSILPSVFFADESNLIIL